MEVGYMVGGASEFNFPPQGSTGVGFGWMLAMGEEAGCRGGSQPLELFTVLGEGTL